MALSKLTVDFTAKIDFSLKSKNALFSINKRRDTVYNYIKPKQIDCVKDALNFDTLVILPTGYGKSLIYELVQEISQTKVIIISPINAIIDEQVNRLGSSALKLDDKLVSKLEQKNAVPSEVLNGSVKYLIGHPEQFLKKSVCDAFSDKNAWSNVQHIFVDEAHCVSTWGHDFRPAFAQLCKLRSIFPMSYIIAMTATATIQLQTDIIEKLLMKLVRTVSSNPNRDNVKLAVKRRGATSGGKRHADDSVEDLLMPYVKELCKQKKEFNKTIIYCNLKTCGLGYEIVRREALKNTDYDSIMKCVSQYHSPCTDQKKKHVAEEMRDTEGHIKLLFATEAYGMGADAPDVRQIIHVGPPNSLETYLQETGRAGRDGKLSVATLFFNENDLGSNRKNLKTEMRDFCRLNTCRRQFICRHFGYDKPSVTSTVIHSCCDVCGISCECNECFSGLLENMEVDIIEKSKQPESFTSPSDQEMAYLKSALDSYFRVENEVNNGVVYTGLSDDILNKIVSQQDKYVEVCDLQTAFPHIAIAYLINIFHIIKYVNSDCQFQSCP